jgi:NADH:ubiquinone oxidoreductase subunit 6 (subunit J)
MSIWEFLNAGQLASLVGAVMVSVAVGVGVVVAIGTAEVRSRRGESERVAVIRQTLLRERQPARRGDRGRS